jgi:formate dehydrogenase subunit gamma
MDGEVLARRVLDRFGVDWGETTLDGRVTIEATYCLGLCATAPSGMLDGEPMARLSMQSVDEIAQEIDR